MIKIVLLKILKYTLIIIGSAPFIFTLVYGIVSATNGHCFGLDTECNSFFSFKAFIESIKFILPSMSLLYFIGLILLIIGISIKTKKKVKKDVR